MARQSSSRTVKIGISASLSGQFQVQGRQALAGIQTWAEDLNRSGGLLVRDLQARLPVTVLWYDDASSPELARQATQRLILEDRVDLLMGPYSSALTEAAAPVAERHGWVLWNQGGASDRIHQRGYRWVVGILAPASEYLVGLLPLVRDADPPAKTLAIVRAATGNFPRAVCSGVERSANALGFQVVLREEYASSLDDFRELADAIARVRPDVLVAVGRIQNDLGLARLLARQHGVRGAVAVVAAPIQPFRDALGEDVEGFLGPTQWELSGDWPHDYGPSGPEVVASLRRRGHHPIDYPMVQAYAAGLVAQRCVEAAGTLDQGALRTAAGLEFTTFYGRFQIDPATGRQVGHSVALVQWQGGRKVVVWPPERRQARLVYPWRGNG